MTEIVNYNKGYEYDGNEKNLYDTEFSLFKVEGNKIIFYNFIADKFFHIEKTTSKMVINQDVVNTVFGATSFNPCPEDKMNDLKSLLEENSVEEMLKKRQEVYEYHNANRGDDVATRRPWLNCLNKLLFNVDPSRRGNNYNRMVNRFRQSEEIKVEKVKEMRKFKFPSIAADPNNLTGWSGTGGAVSSEIISLLHLLEYRNNVNNNFNNNVLPTLKGGFLSKNKLSTIFEQLREIVEIVEEGRKNNAKWLGSLLTLLEKKYNILVEDNSKKSTIDSKKLTKGGGDIPMPIFPGLTPALWNIFTSPEKQLWKIYRDTGRSRLLNRVKEKAKAASKLYSIITVPTPELIKKLRESQKFIKSNAQVYPTLLENSMPKNVKEQLESIKLKLPTNTTNVEKFKNELDKQLSSSYYETFKKYLFNIIKTVKDNFVSLYTRVNNLSMDKKLIILAIIIGSLYAVAKYYKSKGPNYTGGLPDNLKNITNKSKFLEELIITKYSDIEWELNNYITNTRNDIAIYNKLMTHADHAKQEQLAVFIRKLAQCVAKAVGMLEIIRKHPEILNYKGTGLDVREKIRNKIGSYGTRSDETREKVQKTMTEHIFTIFPTFF